MRRNLDFLRATARLERAVSPRAQGAPRARAAGQGGSEYGCAVYVEFVLRLACFDNCDYSTTVDGSL